MNFIKNAFSVLQQTWWLSGKHWKSCVCVFILDVCYLWIFSHTSETCRLVEGCNLAKDECVYSVCCPCIWVESCLGCTLTFDQCMPWCDDKWVFKTNGQQGLLMLFTHLTFFSAFIVAWYRYIFACRLTVLFKWRWWWHSHQQDFTHTYYYYYYQLFLSDWKYTAIIIKPTFINSSIHYTEYILFIIKMFMFRTLKLCLLVYYNSLKPYVYIKT